jgi:hypothetical protein
MLARISDGQIIEWRRDLTMEQVPLHKRALWREVPAKPDADPRHTLVTGPHVTGDGLEWSVTPRPVETVRAEQVSRLEEAAEARRHALSAPLAGKRDAYLLKAELAVKAELGDTDAQALIASEAAARGVSEPELRALILQRRAAWTAAAMAIETTEAAMKAAVLAAADGPAAVAAADAGVQALEEIG